ncbi:hypothetical protein JCM6882_001878 [Rhodosporidiobolus microsporus]
MTVFESLTNDIANALPTVNGYSKPSETTTSGPTSASLLPTKDDSLASIVTAVLEDKAEGPVALSGYSLTLSQVVDAARKGRMVEVPNDGQVMELVNDSVRFLESKLSSSIYGVTTGFGGSADTRTDDAHALQKALLEHQLCGVLPTSFEGFDLGRGLENSLPLEVVRGAMAIRVNSLTRGHSAVRLVVLHALVQCLNHRITPIVPLRGSISASGDLSPLSYIASAITGHPDVRVHVVHEGKEKILPAREGLALFGLQPVTLGPKEGLGLVNGTAVSASFATLALHDAQRLALLSQVTTALTVEAMVGQQGSFHPFLHDVTRPHPGQIEAAKNIRALLAGSTFAVEKEEEVQVKDDEGVLRQDRYPLRTSPQWLGPIISDLVNAHSILTTEVNSTTDNPIVDVKDGLFHHGGNFQAMAVTNAMEKTRLGLAQIGKLNFAQLTELINCSMNRGLPSCLAGEDPSLNYHAKGLDIAAAAYTSELGHLANPVSTFVQPAEQANQAVNSLALISARRTAEANDVLTLLLSTHLYCALQAIDLRALELDFKAAFEPTLAASLSEQLGAYLPSPASTAITDLATKVKKAINKRWEQTGSYDLEPRWHDAFSFATGLIVEELATQPTSPVVAANPLLALNTWKVSSAQRAIALTRQMREQFFAATASGASSADAPAIKYLGAGTKKVYLFVRDTVGVKARRGDVFLGREGDTIGRAVSRIVEAVKGGRMERVLVEALTPVAAAA